MALKVRQTNFKTTRCRTVKPGQKGSKELVEKYGESLICVRYRYDSVHCLRRKTIELIVESAPWKPKRRNLPGHAKVYVRVAYGEIHLGRLLRQAGGTWQPEKKLWEVRYDAVKALGLEDRVVRFYKSQGK